MATKISEKIVVLVQRRPGLTEREIAEGLFGKRGYQQKVNQDCRLLAMTNKIERRGEGGPGDPFRYFIPKKGDR